MRNSGWSGSSVPPPVSYVDVIRLGLCVEGAGRFIGHDDGAALLKGAPSHCAGVHLRRNVIYDRSHRSGFNRVKAPACVASAPMRRENQAEKIRRAPSYSARVERICELLHN